MLDLIREFFRPRWVGIAGLALGAYSALNSGGGGGGYSGGTGTSVPIYVPTGQPGADQQFQGMQGMQTGAAERNAQFIDPQLWAAYQQMLDINTAPIGQAGQQAGQQYGALSNQAIDYSSLLGGQGRASLAAGQDVYNLARDPNNQLHDYMRGQTVDASRAATSARGVGMSPYAAGVENDATRNFEMGWQNNLLDRANTGISAMARANQVGGADFSGAIGFGQQAPQFAMQGAMAPISAQQQQFGMPGEFATWLSGQEASNVFGPLQSQQANILPYLGYGTNAGAAAFSAGLGQANFRNNIQQQELQNLYGGLQGFQGAMNTPGSWLNNNWGGGGGGGSDPSAWQPDQSYMAGGGMGLY